MTTTTNIAVDQVLVEVRDPDTGALVTSRLTDGLGYVAFVDLAPRTYELRVPAYAHLAGNRETVVVRAGGVTRFAIRPAAKGNEGRREPKETKAGFDPQEAHVLPNGER